MFSDEPMQCNVGAAVNVNETNAGYELQVVAPGLKKEDFKVSIDRNILTISYDHTETEAQEGVKSIRREFSQKSFKRNFTLTERIDTSNISARYADGILYVGLPKKEVEQTKQDINVD